MALKTVAIHLETFSNERKWTENSFRFQIFGDLFALCPQAIQTQHPGFYYQESAYQSMARKQIAQTTCRRVEQADFDSSEFLKPTEFYGQRPWRQHHQSKFEIENRSDNLTCEIR